MRLKRLDGLRAVAVLLVVLAHNNLIDLGWTGIELSFALSGFLMTRILRDSRTDESYWYRFYFKRAVRIIPLYVAALIVNIIATRMSRVGVAEYIFFLGDVANAQNYGRGAIGVLGPIAVGAHFLLLWSVAVRFLKHKSLVTIAVTILAIEPLLRHFYTPYSPGFEPIFNLTIFCLDSLAAGSLLALLVESPRASRHLAKWSAWAASVLLAAFLLVSYLFSPWFVRSYNTVLYNTTTYATLAAIAFFLVAWVLFLREGTYAERTLSWAPLLFIGRISYGLYLFHPFLNVIVKKLLHLPFGIAGEHANREVFPLVFTISVALSTLLYRYVQLPIQEWGSRRLRRLDLERGNPPRSEQDAIGIHV